MSLLKKLKHTEEKENEHHVNKHNGHNLVSLNYRCSRTRERMSTKEKVGIISHCVHCFINFVYCIFSFITLHALYCNQFCFSNIFQRGREER